MSSPFASLFFLYLQPRINLLVQVQVEFLRDLRQGLFPFLSLHFVYLRATRAPLDFEWCPKVASDRVNNNRRANRPGLAHTTPIV